MQQGSHLEGKPLGQEGAHAQACQDEDPTGEEGQPAALGFVYLDVSPTDAFFALCSLYVETGDAHSQLDVAQDIDQQKQGRQEEDQRGQRADDSHCIAHKNEDGQDNHHTHATGDHLP